MEILIAGDLVINFDYNAENIDSKIVELYKQSDLNIINLEAPITKNNTKIIKTGPHLKGHEKSTLEVLKLLNIGIVTLANNHILDFDEKGVQDTLEFCDNHEIQSVGAGKNLREASETLFNDSPIGKIAIVNFTENEWSCAGVNSAGANPMDIINNINHIKKAKQSADFVVVIIHGGNEHFKYPSPRMVRQYRFYAENGANIIIGHHTHCINGYEIHQGVPIFYSLGNFLFTTEKPKQNSWYTGLILKLHIQREKEIEFEILPVSLAKDNMQLSLLKNQEKQEIYQEINHINSVIKDEKALAGKWEEFVKKSKKAFITNLSPIAGINNVYIRAALYRLNLYKALMNKRYLRETLNRIRCEAHYDITKEVFQQQIK